MNEPATQRNVICWSCIAAAAGTEHSGVRTFFIILALLYAFVIPEK